MTKHISRKQRWAKVDAKRYSSALGEVVYEKKGWYAVMNYRTLDTREEDRGSAQWTTHSVRLGPYKRPRNAMIALEQEVTVLKNRHGKDCHGERPA